MRAFVMGVPAIIGRAEWFFRRRELARIPAPYEAKRRLARRTGLQPYGNESGGEAHRYARGIIYGDVASQSLPRLRQYAKQLATDAATPERGVHGDQAYGFAVMVGEGDASRTAALRISDGDGGSRLRQLGFAGQQQLLPSMGRNSTLPVAPHEAEQLKPSVLPLVRFEQTIL